MKKNLIKIPGNITLREFAEKINIAPYLLIKELMKNGILLNLNQVLTENAINLLAEKYNLNINFISQEDTIEPKKKEIVSKKLVPRPPVVTVMGHIDHGKTTLLDAIRKTNVAENEPGQITQHIGAYKVKTKAGEIIFIDTPGHEAFTRMRARGAKITDIVVLVIAADDGIMPQTVEAINHARAADVPIIVCINKIDLPHANPSKIMQELPKYGLIPEKWGGDIFVEEISAKKKTNIDALLDTIIFQAELLELKTDLDCPGEGTVIESRLDSKRGITATVLLEKGKVKIGKYFMSNSTYGRIRMMFDDNGKKIKTAQAVMPIEVFGFDSLPTPGDRFKILEDEKKPKVSVVQNKVANHFRKLVSPIPSDEKKLNIILKVDVQGSLEPILNFLKRESLKEVPLNVVHSGVGPVNESDINLAILTGSTIFAFNVKPLPKAESLANSENVKIRTHRVIYDLFEDIKNIQKGLIKPPPKEILIGKAEIKKVFNIPNVGNVAGCLVIDGKVEVDRKTRLLRDNIIVYEGIISSLRRFKDNVREVSKGLECGIALSKFQDIKVGDIIEVYKTE